MPRKPVYQILLISIAVLGFLATALETVALVNDIMWNVWITEEIRKNKNRPPPSLMERAYKGSIKSINDINSALKRDDFWEPTAVGIMIINFGSEVVICVLFILGRANETTVKFWLFMVAQSMFNFLAMNFIIISALNYESSYKALRQVSIMHEGMAYGNYTELRHCEVQHLRRYDRTPTPKKGACQLKELKFFSVSLMCCINLVQTTIVLLGFCRVSYWQAYVAPQDDTPERTPAKGSEENPPAPTTEEDKGTKVLQSRMSRPSSPRSPGNPSPRRRSIDFSNKIETSNSTGSAEKPP